MSTAPAPRYELVPVDRLEPDPENARTHDARNLQAIAESIKQFGRHGVIVARRIGKGKDWRGVVVAGSGTLVAARDLAGLKEVMVEWTPLTGAKLRAFAIAMNRTAELAAWDNVVLLDVLRVAVEEDVLAATGFSEQEHEKLTTEAVARERSSSIRSIVMLRSPDGRD